MHDDSTFSNRKHELFPCDLNQWLIITDFFLGGVYKVTLAQPDWCPHMENVAKMRKKVLSVSCHRGELTTDSARSHMGRRETNPKIQKGMNTGTGKQTGAPKETVRLNCQLSSVRVDHWWPRRYFSRIWGYIGVERDPKIQKDTDTRRQTGAPEGNGEPKLSKESWGGWGWSLMVTYVLFHKHGAT